jgi:hypothetical protein
MLSDLDHNPRGQQAVVISATFTALALVVVSLRLYTRLFLVRSPGVEDYGVSLAMVSKPVEPEAIVSLMETDMFCCVDCLHRLS